MQKNVQICILAGCTWSCYQHQFLCSKNSFVMYIMYISATHAGLVHDVSHWQGQNGSVHVLRLCDFLTFIFNKLDWEIFRTLGLKTQKMQILSSTCFLCLFQRNWHKISTFLLLPVFSPRVASILVRSLAIKSRKTGLMTHLILMPHVSVFFMTSLI